MKNRLSLQWRIQAGAHPARAPPLFYPTISPTRRAPARGPRPLFHSLFTKSCVSIITLLSQLYIKYARGSHCGSPAGSKKRAQPIIAFLSVARRFSAQSFCFGNTDWLNRKERLFLSDSLYQRISTITASGHSIVFTFRFITDE